MSDPLRRGSATIRFVLCGLACAQAGCMAWQPGRGVTRVTDQPGAATPEYVVRGQDGRLSDFAGQQPGTDSYRQMRTPVSVAQAQYTPPANAYPPAGSASPAFAPPPPPNVTGAAPLLPGTQPPLNTAPPLPPGAVSPFLTPAPGVLPPAQPYVDIDPTMTTPLDVYVEETQTGRFMFGAGINSDAGVTGQIVIDERNFDFMRFPTSFRDFAEGSAFRGAGQGFRLEAMPGTQVQRYLVSFTEPYLLDTQVSLNLSGFYYDRSYFDWDENRLGGRVALGYRLTHDLSLATSLRAERVRVSDARVPIPDLLEVLGDNSLYSGRLTLTHDTRDVPFAPTEGHLFEVGFEQAFGDFDFPRADFDYRQYFLMRERADGSGRHTLGFLFRLGFTGAQTPVFERYFAGGYSTLRGFDFRDASPEASGVRVGGDFLFLGSVEYLFPLTADDMLKGALFVDYGTVEKEVEIKAGNYRVAPGFGLRVNVPALGPAPLAFDFAFPVASAPTDDERIFSFFFGVGR